ncbi:MAG: DnaD domain protein [Bacilli bacterium]|nr:DnaD domain protein [Bacilli bacterium]
MKNNNILPADTYVVINKSIIDTEDRKILTMLYQPVIGPIAIMLYFSLWSDLDKSDIISKEFTHHHLITNMQLSLEEIVTERRKLEAIGLLKTFYKEENINNYIYQLYSPITASEFFNHPILNVVLYNNTGKKEYEEIKSYFKIPRINTSGYRDITSSFTEVFSSVPLTSYEILNDDIRQKNVLKLNIDTNFDFDFLISSLPNSIDKERIFTKEIKELILELSYLYDLDVIKMQDIIMSCINERNTINKEDLRKTCRNYYQFDNHGLLPSVVYNSQPEYLKKPEGDTSKRAKMIYTFETLRPYELLKSKNQGREPTNRDIKLAEDLIINYGLKPGVANVLIDYILKTNDNKLTRSLAETIAGQWQRLNIETVEDAMRIAEKEHKKYKKNNITTKIKTTSNTKLPEWFDKEIKKEEVSKDSLEEMQNLLKEYN